MELGFVAAIHEEGEFAAPVICQSRWKISQSLQGETFIPVPISEKDAESFAISPDKSLHGTQGEFYIVRWTFSCLYANALHFHFLLYNRAGPIKKSYPKEWSKLHENLFKSVEDLGIPKTTEAVSIK